MTDDSTGELDSQIAEAKEFLNENGLVGKDLIISCDFYKEKLEEALGFVIDALIVIPGIPALLIVLLKMAKKRLDKHCGIAST